MRPGKTTIGAGGAIVIQSDPVEEFDELLLKARAPMAAIAQAMTGREGAGAWSVVLEPNVRDSGGAGDGMRGDGGAGRDRAVRAASLPTRRRSRMACASCCSSSARLPEHGGNARRRERDHRGRRDGGDPGRRIRRQVRAECS